MNIVKTTAPISIENLKQYFTDKSTFYIIDYKNSTLKGAKLLTYLSNLDIPCDIDFADCNEEECYDMLKTYMSFNMIVNIATLENLMIYLIKQYKNIVARSDEKFLLDNENLFKEWISKLDSLTLYNMSIVNDDNFKEFANAFEKDDSQTTSGINFISLLKHQSFYETYGVIDKTQLKYYTHYFNDYMFKGKNMYSFWANGNNPMFLLTYGISEGLINPEDYNNAKRQTLEELGNATSIW